MKPTTFEPAPHLLRVCEQLDLLRESRELFRRVRDAGAALPQEIVDDLNRPDAPDPLTFLCEDVPRLQHLHRELVTWELNYGLGRDAGRLDGREALDALVPLINTHLRKATRK